MDQEQPDKYNPNRIIQAANEKLQQDADWQGGDLLFQTALLQWSDDARESGGDESLRESLATLYMAYAHFLASAKQFRSTMDAYENATQDANVNYMGRIWLEYAAFCQERQKYVKAQQVYLRALVGDKDGNPPAVPDEQDRDVLWHSFWEMMKEQNKNSDMTLEELQTAVMSEHGKQQGQPSVKTDADETRSSSYYGDHEPAYKKIKLEDGSGPATTTTTAPAAAAHSTTNNNNASSVATSTDPDKVHVVVPEAVKTAEAEFLKVLQQPDLPPEIKAAWLMLDGTGLAQPPEPPLFSVSPPKLSDPSGKDILGVDLALALTRQLLQTGRGSLVLQVCRALWVMTAVHERAAAQRLDRLDADLQTAVAQREAEFASRRSVAQAAHQQSVEQVIQQERQALQQSCGSERQKLLQEMAWQARRLLCAQQVILHKLQIPTFENGPTVDAATLEWQAKVCSYLHSAFYLRNRIGEATHMSMLQSQCKKLVKEQEQQEQQQQQSSAPPPPPPAENEHNYNSNNNSSSSSNNSNNPMYNNPHGGGGGYYPPPPPPPPPSHLPPPGYGQPPPVYGGGGYAPPQQPYPGGMQQAPHPDLPPPPPPHYGGPPPPPPPPRPGSYPYYRR